jgi:hypothetical protein
MAVVTPNPAAAVTLREQIVSPPSEKYVTVLVRFKNDGLHIKLGATVNGESAA